MPKIPLSEIGYDPKFYPRVNGREDWLTVHRYTDALKADPEKDFPAVVVVKAVAKAYRYMLVDGKHRCAAYKGADRESIPAVVESLPQSKWFARSVELNAAHGRVLDVGDKAWIAVRLEEDGYTVQEIASLLHMRVESLEKIKIEHVVKIRSAAAKAEPLGRAHREANGRHFGFLKAPFKDFAGTATAEQALAVQDPVSSLDVLHILDSAIAVLECGLDATDEEIAGRLERLRELLAP